MTADDTNPSTEGTSSEKEDGTDTASVVYADNSYPKSWSVDPSDVKSCLAVLIMLALIALCIWLLVGVAKDLR